MADRRMFTQKIVDSDAFLDMPLSTQALYFHLAMRADDDGFINNHKRIQRMIGASDDDMKVLLAKRFILSFESGVIVIKHWRMHNYIQKDRYKETVYQEEKAMLTTKDNGAYTLDTVCIQNGYSLDTQVSIGKDSIGKTKDNGTKRFQKPTLDEVKAYCLERNNNVDAERWYDYYTANGWKVGKNTMKDWKASVRTWERQDKPKKEDNWFEGLA